MIISVAAVEHFQLLLEITSDWFATLLFRQLPFEFIYFILFTRIKPFHSYLYMEGSICDCASLGFVGSGGFTIASA